MIQVFLFCLATGAIQGDFTITQTGTFNANLAGTDNVGNTFDLRLHGVSDFPFGGIVSPNQLLGLTSFFQIFTSAPNIFASGSVNGVATPVFVYFRHNSSGNSISTDPLTWEIRTSVLMPGPPADDTVQQIVTTIFPMTWDIDFVADDQDRWVFDPVVTPPIPPGSELLDVDQSGDGLTVIDWSWVPAGRFYETFGITYLISPAVPEPNSIAIWAVMLAAMVLIQRRVGPAGNFRAGSWLKPTITLPPPAEFTRT